MTNVLILGANGQLARNTTRVFLAHTDADIFDGPAMRFSVSTAGKPTNNPISELRGRLAE